MYVNLENLRAYIPNHLLETRGVIRGVDTQFDEEYLNENLESPAKIINIKRLHRQILRDAEPLYVPKQTVVVTFEGNFLPNSLFIHGCFYL